MDKFCPCLIEVKASHKNISRNSANKNLVAKNINLKFKTPINPCKGGLWVSLVRYAKLSLEVIIRDNLFKEKCLSNILSLSSILLARTWLSKKAIGVDSSRDYLGQVENEYLPPQNLHKRLTEKNCKFSVRHLVIISNRHATITTRVYRATTQKATGTGR